MWRSRLPAGYVTGGVGLPASPRDNGDGTQTVTYHAQGVIDFAWTASPHFQEAHSQVDGVEIALPLPAGACLDGRAGRWMRPRRLAQLFGVVWPLPLPAPDGGGCAR